PSFSFFPYTTLFRSETYISDTGEFGIHSGIGNQETIARPRLGIFLVNFDLELAPSRHVVLCIQIVAEHVVRRRVIGSALETARQDRKSTRLNSSHLV